MAFCPKCQRNDVAEQWEFCPRCGAELRADAPPLATAGRGGDLDNALLGVALGVAGTVLQSRMEGALGPIAKFVDQWTAAPPTVPSTPWPEWYAAAVAQQQPTTSAAQLARLQAKEITETRLQTEMVRSLIETHKEINRMIWRD